MGKLDNLEKVRREIQLNELRGFGIPEPIAQFLVENHHQSDQRGIRFQIRLNPDRSFSYVAERAGAFIGQPRIRYEGKQEDLKYILSFLVSKRAVDAERQVTLLSPFMEEITDLSPYLIPLVEKAPPPAPAKAKESEEEPYRFLNPHAEDYEAQRAQMQATMKPNIRNQGYEEYIRMLFQDKRLNSRSFEPEIRNGVTAKILQKPGDNHKLDRFIALWKTRPIASQRLTDEEEANLRIKIKQANGLSIEPAEKQSYRDYIANLFDDKRLNSNSFIDQGIVRQQVVKAWDSPRGDIWMEKFITSWKARPDARERLSDDEAALLMQKAQQVQGVAPQEAMDEYSAYTRQLFSSKRLKASSFLPDLRVDIIAPLFERPPVTKAVADQLAALWMARPEKRERLTEAEAQQWRTLYRQAKGLSTAPAEEQDYAEYMRSLFFEKELYTRGFAPLSKTCIADLCKRPSRDIMEQFLELWRNHPEESKRLTPDEEALLRAKIGPAKGLSTAPDEEQSYAEYIATLFDRQKLGLYQFPGIASGVVFEYSKRPPSTKAYLDQWLDAWKTLPGEQQLTDEAAALILSKAKRHMGLSTAPVEEQGYAEYMATLCYEKGLLLRDFTQTLGDKRGKRIREEAPYGEDLVLLVRHLGSGLPPDKRPSEAEIDLLMEKAVEERCKSMPQPVLFPANQVSGPKTHEAPAVRARQGGRNA